VVLRKVELKVELPCGRPWRILSLLVHEGEAQLNDLQQVHVAAQQLVLVVGVAAEHPDRPGDYTRKLGVLATQHRSMRESRHNPRTISISVI